MPVAITAIVGNPLSNAARCAVMSVPIASPLTMAGLHSGQDDMAETILVHHSLPYDVMSLVPTTDIFFGIPKMLSSGERLLT